MREFFLKNAQKLQKMLEKYMKNSDKFVENAEKCQKNLFIKNYCTKIVGNARKAYENCKKIVENAENLYFLCQVWPKIRQLYLTESQTRRTGPSLQWFSA